MFKKGEVIDYVWQYSRYYGELLSSCNSVVYEINGFAGLIYLFNLTETIFKDRVKNYDEGFCNAIYKLKQENIINDKEYYFLNNKKMV